MSRLFVDTLVENDLEDVFLFQNRLDLRGSGDLSEHWWAVVELRVEYWIWGEGNPDGPDLLVNGEDYQVFFEARVRDAYLSGRYGPFFVTLGNQNVVWGAGTLSQPAAVINPVDYRLGGVGMPAELRLPVWAAQAAVVGDRLSVSAVFVPVFEAHELSVLGTDFSLLNASQRPSGFLPALEQRLPPADATATPFTQLGVAVTSWPTAVPKNASAGFRVSTTSGGLDVGLGYVYGWDRTPFATFESLGSSDVGEPSGAEGEAAAYSSRYLRQHTVEADLVLFLGRVAVRAEAVFHPEQTVYLESRSPADDADQLPEASRLPAVLSALALSYEPSESLIVQVEGVWRHTFDVPADRALVLYDEDDFAVAVLVIFGLDAIRSLRGTILEALSFELTGLVGISSKDYSLFPEAIWSFSDALDLGLGATLYGGPDLSERFTVGGLFDENDQVYVSLDVRF